MAYSKGQPIMSDEDYDTLKNELRTRGSIVSAQVGWVGVVFKGVCDVWRGGSVVFSGWGLAADAPWCRSIVSAQVGFGCVSTHGFANTTQCQHRGVCACCIAGTHTFPAITRCCRRGRVYIQQTGPALQPAQQEDVQ